jgi:hypothetical protein
MPATSSVIPFSWATRISFFIISSGVAFSLNKKNVMRMRDPNANWYKFFSLWCCEIDVRIISKKRVTLQRGRCPQLLDFPTPRDHLFPK